MAKFTLKGNDLNDDHGHLKARVAGNDINDDHGHLVARVAGVAINDDHGHKFATLDDVKRAIQGATGKTTDVALWLYFAR